MLFTTAVRLDDALAELYGVPLKALKQAVKRNLDRFPEDFMFQLTEDEAARLRSQIVTLEPSWQTGGTMGDPPMIRVAAVADGPEVARAFGAAWARMDFVPKLHSPDEDRAFFTGQLEQGRGLLAEQEGVVVGFAIHDAHRLCHLYVHPAWQGRGIGVALLSAVKAALPGGFDLWTFQPNAGARRFYERHGLQCVEHTDGSGNEERVPDMRYLWRGIASR
ncbi:MAG: GNAT family N-acetyltransferase [Polyangiales bacterium]